MKKLLIVLSLILISSCVVEQPKTKKEVNSSPTASNSLNIEPVFAPDYNNRDSMYYSWEEHHFENNESMSVAYIDDIVCPTVNNLEIITSMYYRIDRSYPVEVYICQDFKHCVYEKRVSLSAFNQRFQDLKNPNTNWFISQEYYVENESIFVSGELELTDFSIIIVKYHRGERY